MSNRLFKVRDEDVYFYNAQESQEYAKNNPGKVIVRNLDSSDDTSPYIYQNSKIPQLNISPKKILDYLNQHIISQDEAKKDIALAMYYHSLKSKYLDNDQIGTNGPVMIVGPTGSGKTFLVQKACECIDTLFLHVDTASMVPEGIKGYSVNSLMQDLIYMADEDMQKASKAVVFLDEMDKLFIKDESDLNYGTRVSSQLLRLLEGGTFKVYDGQNREKESIDFSTKNIQFILGGAFQSILDNKQKKQQTVGFTKDVQSYEQQKITLEDLYKSNVPKELLGRMSTVVNIYPLSQNDYYEILTKSKSSPLKEFIDKIEFHGDSVEINDETLKEVSKLASKSQLGSRAIKQILQNLFSEALFEAPVGQQKTHQIIFKDKVE
jgi:ATP-dependent Clp protease ATP-binding subunit ClpX